MGDRQKGLQDQSLEEKEELALRRGTIENREKKRGGGLSLCEGENGNYCIVLYI